MWGPRMPVDRYSMPAGRLQNAATVVERNIYWERARANFVTNPPNVLKSTLEPNSGFPVAPKINQFDPNHAEQRADRQPLEDLFSSSLLPRVINASEQVCPNFCTNRGNPHETSKQPAYEAPRTPDIGFRVCSQSYFFSPPDTKLEHSVSL